MIGFGIFATFVIGAVLVSLCILIFYRYDSLD